MAEIRMPKLTESMTEGVVLRWLRGEGERVATGDDILEIETDKASVDFAADSAGVLRHLVAEGETVSVGVVIGSIGTPGENHLGGTGTGTESGVDAATGWTREQRLIAERVTSAAGIPAYTVSVEVDMSAVQLLREGWKRTGRTSLPSVNDVVVRACADALVAQPVLNGVYREDKFVPNPDVNIGIVVATARTLYVPVIRNADRLSLDDLSAQAADLIDRARRGDLTPDLLTGATFTVSNLGGLGVTRFDAMINQGQAAILAVGAVRDEPVVRDGAVRPGRRMSLTLTCDHRIVYGAHAAAFLTRVRDDIENPSSLDQPADRISQ